MTDHFSRQVSKWLVREGVIRGDDLKIYSFAAYSFLFGLLPIGISAILGFLFGMLKESLLMLLPYMLLRKFSGGFHLKSPYACIIISTLVITLALVLVKQLVASEDTPTLLLCVFLSVLSLCVNSPVASAARRLSLEERKLFRIITIALSCLSLLVFIWVEQFYPSNIHVPIGVGILLVAILQIPCIITKVFSTLKQLSSST